MNGFRVNNKHDYTVALSLTGLGAQRLRACLALSLALSVAAATVNVCQAAWLRDLNYDAATGQLALQASLQPGESQLPQPPTVTESVSVTGAKRLVIQWNQVDLESSFASNEALLARLQKTWPALTQVKAVSFNQGSQPTVRLMLDLAANAPLPAVTTNAGLALMASPMRPATLTLANNANIITERPATMPPEPVAVQSVTSANASASVTQPALAATPDPVAQAPTPPVGVLPENGAPVIVSVPSVKLAPKATAAHPASSGSARDAIVPPDSQTTETLQALQAGIKQAQTQLEKAFETINRQNQQIESLKATQTTLQAKLTRQLGAAAAAAAPSAPKPNAEASVNAAKLARLESTLAETETEKQALKESIQSQTNKAEALEQENAALQASLAALQRDLQTQKTLNTQLSSATPEVKKLTAQYEQKIDALNAEMMQKSEQITKLTAQVQADDRLAQQHDANQQEIKTLAAKLSDATAALTAAESKEAALAQQIAALESASTRVQESAQAQTQSEARLKAQDSELARLNQQLATLKAQSQSDSEKLSALNAQLQSANQTLATVQTELQDERVKLAQATQALSKKAATPVVATKPALAPDTAPIKAALSQEQAKNQQLAQQITALQAQLQQAQSALAMAAQAPAPAGASGANAQAALQAAQAQADKIRAAGVGSSSQAVINQALGAYRNALKMDPENPEIIAAFAEFELELGKTTEAIALLDAAMVKPVLARNPQLVNLLGKSQLLSGQAQAAATTYADGIPLALLSNYGLSLKNAGQSEQAEAVIKAALAIAPEDAELHFNLGNLYLESQRPEGAATEYQQALRFKQSFTEAHYNLGIALSQTGQTAQAIKHLEQYLSLSPRAANAGAVRQFITRLKG
ncbi:MAG: tetratricopeptide repeat protein [Vampirovibrionales bacterium]|nr:tetratricopeptide repeat protein [Vampirovibrionales bacterium]